LIKKENKYLKIGFWRGVAYSFLFIFLFPISLIYFLIFRGLSDTGDFLEFLARDMIVSISITLLFILLVVMPLIFYLLNKTLGWIFGLFTGWL